MEKREREGEEEKKRGKRREDEERGAITQGRKGKGEED